MNLYAGSSALRLYDYRVLLQKLAENKRVKTILKLFFTFAGNAVSEKELDRKVSHKTKGKFNTEREKTSREECIETEDDEIEEKENKNRNVSKSRKAIKKPSLLTQKTVRKEAKTPLKTPQRGRHN